MPLPPEQWTRVKELFDAAVELPPGERSALLDQFCNGDDTLRKEVESLLRSDDRAASFIEEPALRMPRDLLAEEAAESFADQQLGAYRTIREIGRGGLGTVYLATRSDDQYQKQVAIKLVRRGLDTEDVLQRFRGERQILAQLEHPNIARLIDAGSIEQGLPYFVMEYVEGQPINSYCDGHKLSTTDRLKLFRLVCGAVTYAHQHLVIHRDIKPSNILVTEEGVPKLVDFGIAKLLHADDPLSALTMTGVRVMTPEYASPEQIRGLPITTSTDIYSLGVLLYELLAGRKPYRLTTHTAEELSRAVVEQLPERPSTAIQNNQQSEVSNHKFLRGDLDNIVLMALRKEPERRYASVEQFSEDIRRHLEGRPVIAHKDTVGYRAGKFVKRHKAGVFATALVAFTLLAGIVTTLREKRRAERRFNDVRQLSNALLFDIAPKIERLQGSTDAREALVRRALDYLDSLARESSDDVQLQSELAAAYEKVGDLQGMPRKAHLGDFAGAIASYEKARAIWRQVRERRPDDRATLQRVAANLAALSFIRYWTSDVTGALRDNETASEIYRALLRAEPESIELQLAAAEMQMELATIHYFNDQIAAVYAPLRDALAVLEGIRAAAPSQVEVLRLLGRGRTLLGMTLAFDNQLSQGEAELEQAFAINKALVAQHPRDSILRQGLLHTYLQSSQLYEDKTPERSFTLLNEARQIVEESVAKDPADNQAREHLAKTYSKLGLIAVQGREIDQAVRYLEKAAATFAELERLEPKNTTHKHDIGSTLMYLGQARQQRQDFSGALAEFEQAAALFASDVQADSKNIFALRKVATVHSYMGAAHREKAHAGVAFERSAQLASAKRAYEKAADVFLQLDTLQALTERDRPFLTEAQRGVRTCEQELADIALAER